MQAPKGESAAAKAHVLLAALATQTAQQPAPLPARLASVIDQTLLKPEATPGMVEHLCAEARALGFAAVCVNSFHVERCVGALAGSPVAVCSVTGFPLGANLTEVKVYEAEAAVRLGASEIDMVINVGALKAAAYDQVGQDIARVVQACHHGGALCKVILETCLLTDEEKVIACLLAQEAGVDLVKTSTGLSTGGATVADVRLMRAVVGSTMGVKAAGGIRSRADALAMLEAGASRIGTSAGVKIVQAGGMEA
ncbi:MAG: deoxyribose-phosphate aldolase [Anaerolineae bacterium]